MKKEQWQAGTIPTALHRELSEQGHAFSRRQPGPQEAEQNHGKPKVAFLCVHNSCRSQMAEALGKKLAGDVFDSFSAGTEPQIGRAHV